jgi:hypothetical protein
LADLYNPEDVDVKKHEFDIVAVAKARIEGMCEALRLDTEVAEIDPDVIEVLKEFEKASKIFQAALQAFARPEFSEKEILLRAINGLQLDASALASELWALFSQAEEQFLAASGLPRESLQGLRLHRNLRYRIEDAVIQLRGRAPVDLHLRKDGKKGEFDVQRMWHIGEWPGLAQKKAASKLRRPEYALWTDGASWKLYEEKIVRRRGDDDLAVGELFEEGRLADGFGLPVPTPSSEAARPVAAQALADTTPETPAAGGFMV